MALPSGYTRLDYIQSSGTQYINTGFKPNGNSRIVMDCEPTSVDNTFGFFCARTATSATDATSNTLFLISGNYRKDFYGTSKTTSGAYGAGKRITIDSNKNNVTIGTDYSLSLTASTNSSPMALLLMATAVPGSTAGTLTNIANFAKMKLYSAQVYDNGTLVRDFIPCKNASGAIGLWDNVNSVFYANAGTGTFSTGKKHKVLINGTGYETKSGRVLIAGTGYDIKKGRTLIGGTGYDIKFDTPVGELAVGTSVFMNVGGVRTEFIVVHQGDLLLTVDKPTNICSGTWVMKKSGSLGTYFDQDNMQDGFLPKLDAEIQRLLKPISCYTASNSVASRKITIPHKENVVSEQTAIEHSMMDYFANGGSKIVFLDGVAKSWWLGGHYFFIDNIGMAYALDSKGNKVSAKTKNFYVLRTLLLLQKDDTSIESDYNIIPT